MRLKRSTGKILNLALVVTVSLCIAVVRPAYLHAGPCADAAAAAYADAQQGFRDALGAGRAAWEAARAEADDDYTTADATYSADMASCNDALQEAITPYAAALAAALLAITVIWVLAVAECEGAPPCIVIADTAACAADIAAVDIYNQATASFYEDFEFCKSPVQAAFDAAGIDYNDAYVAADAAFAEIVSYNAYTGPADAMDAYDAAIAACPDPDE